MIYEDKQIVSTISKVMSLNFSSSGGNTVVSTDRKVLQTGLKKLRVGWCFSPEDVDEIVNKVETIIIFSADGIRIPKTYKVIPHENFIGGESLWKEKLRKIIKNNIEYIILHPDIIQDYSSAELQ